MTLAIRSGVPALFLAATVLAARAPAENEGLRDLDRANEAKLNAKTLSDLGEVIRLYESALEKGLDEDNTRFAKQLLAATRIDRGSRIAEAIIESGRPDAMWPRYRRLALEDLEKGVEFDPQQPHALLRIAQLNLLPQGDARRARQALDESIRLSTEEPKLRCKALLLRAGQREKPEERLADLDEAVRTNPNSATAVRVRGVLHYDQEEFESALADFNKALELEPDHVPTLVDQSEALIELKRYEEAMASLAKARQLAPKWVEPLLQQARIHGLQTEFEKAVDVLQEAYLLSPADPRVLLLRAAVYQEIGKKKEALADVDEVLKLSPSLPEAVRLQAMRFRAALLADSREFDLAASQLEELRKSKPEDVEVELLLAFLYVEGNQPGKAIEKFSAVLEKQPDNANALRGRGTALLSVGRQAEAIADYERALKFEPDDHHVLNNLSWVLATSPDEKLRDGKRSIELAIKACELTKYNQAHILSTLAAGYAETGDFETAIKWSQKAVELGSEDQQEALTKELETYKAGKPFRELLTGPDSKDEEADRPAEPEKPAPEAPAPESEKPKPAPQSDDQP